MTEFLYVVAGVVLGKGDTTVFQTLVKIDGCQHTRLYGDQGVCFLVV